MDPDRAHAIAVSGAARASRPAAPYPSAMGLAGIAETNPLSLRRPSESAER